jgi:hypothetical protein
MWLTVGKLSIGVLLSFFDVAYFGAVDVVGLRCIVDSVVSRLGLCAVLPLVSHCG